MTNAGASGPVSESELIRRATAGDAGALSDLLARASGELRRRLQGSIATHWRSVLDDDDIMQVTFLEAFLQIRRFTPTKPGHDGAAMEGFLAWLTTIAKNNLRDAVRGLERDKRPDPRKRVVAGAGTETHVSLVEMLGVHSATPSRLAAAHEIAAAVESGLNHLPPDYARVLRLYDLQGHSIEQVCEELGRRSGAVYMLRARAHDRLREILGSSSNFFSKSP